MVIYNQQQNRRNLQQVRILILQNGGKQYVKGTEIWSRS
nr:MAG TPA: hypothetical protein [Caudoviricetes sp.]DAX31496.1 MAG TPA: hypothetical protein [Caudoviricetes sp.]